MPSFWAAFCFVEKIPYGKYYILNLKFKYKITCVIIGCDSGMREFAKALYLSKAWRQTREYIFKRDCGLCVRCGAPGEIVHHKIHLSPRNINNPDITLSDDNLELLCRECHAIEHEGTSAIDKELMFDSQGNLVQRKEIPC